MVDRLETHLRASEVRDAILWPVLGHCLGFDLDRSIGTREHPVGIENRPLAPSGRFVMLGSSLCHWPKDPKGQDRISVDDDTNGNGRADVVKHFHSDLNPASGMTLREDGVIVDQRTNSVLPLDHCDFVALVVEVDDVHERANQEQASSTAFLQVGGIRWIWQLGAIEAVPLVTNHK